MDDTAGEDDGGSGLVVSVPAWAMGEAVHGDTNIVGKRRRRTAALNEDGQWKDLYRGSANNRIRKIEGEILVGLLKT
jgi:hypothetical protein